MGEVDMFKENLKENTKITRHLHLKYPLLFKKICS